jgi:hypothetical protein
MINSATFTAYEVGDENLGDLLAAVAPSHPQRQLQAE